MSELNEQQIRSAGQQQLYEYCYERKGDHLLGTLEMLEDLQSANFGGYDGDVFVGGKGRGEAHVIQDVGHSGGWEAIHVAQGDSYAEAVSRAWLLAYERGLFGGDDD